MNLKRRKKPIKLQKLEALLPRLSPDFSELHEIKRDTARRFKGHIGEKRVDYHIDQLSSDFTILEDVRLNENGKDFQVDSLVLSNDGIYIIEVKNFTGTITFNTILKQFTRFDGEKETGFRYPITQAETVQWKLMNWLHKHNIQHIPIRYFIAISDPSTIIKVIGNEKEVAQVVAHGEYIPRKILHMDRELRELRIKEDRGKTQLNHHQIGKLILAECAERDFDIFKKYNISIQNILPGVICPQCNQLYMNRGYGIWICKNCHLKSKRAHIATLNDFFLLIKPFITNREGRWFLRVNSRNVVLEILRDGNLQKKGKKWLHASS